MLIKILILILLVLINGVFSATEIAFLSLNKYELKKKVRQGDKRALQITKLLGDMSSFLSAIQIAITLSGFLASAFAAESFATEIAAAIGPTVISVEALTGVLVVVITIILSFFTLVFGELVPKKIGLARANSVATFMAPIITGVVAFFKPFIWILKVSTGAVAKLLHIRSSKRTDEEEIKDTIIDSSLEELEKQLLLNVFEFNDRTVAEVMTPRAEVATLPVDASGEQVMRLFRRQKFTRFPVLEGKKVVGILNVKDILVKHNPKAKSFRLKQHLRPALRLKSDVVIDDAFLYLNAHYEAMAIVEENGEFTGVVTLEDIIESLVGEVFDEYDRDAAKFPPQTAVSEEKSAKTTQ